MDDIEEKELRSDNYLAVISIVAIIVAIVSIVAAVIAAVGVILLPIVPILSILALITAIFAKRSSAQGSSPRRTANIAIVLAALLLVAEIAFVGTFLVKTFWPSPKGSRYPTINVESRR